MAKRLVGLLIIFSILFSTIAYCESASDKLSELYAEAELLMVEKSYLEASEKFESLGTYSDASKMAMYCKALLAAEEYELYAMAVDAFDTLGDFKDSKQMSLYYTGRSYEASGDVILGTTGNNGQEELGKANADYNEAIKIYSELPLFKDCMSRINKCKDKQSQIQLSLDDAKNVAYQKGLEQQANKDWEGAISSFIEAGDYKDSKTQILVTRYMEGIEKKASHDWDGAITAFKKARDYGDAVEQINATRYEEGQAKREAHDWDGAVAIFEALGEYNDSATQIIETRYQEAKWLYDDLKTESSYQLYKTIKGYKDVDNILENDEKFVLIRNAKREKFQKVRNTVSFGHYEQDNKTENGPEEIDWIVLDIQGDKCLLLSKYCLKEVQYNKDYVEVTWEKCSLRKWLNEDFFKIAFNGEEQNAIVLTNVSNGKIQSKKDWKISNGKDTKDKVFILSYHEAFDQYFSNDKERKTTMTKAAIANSVNKDPSWWLRTRQDTAYDYLINAAFVKENGASSVSGGGLTGGICVRPAIWVDLNADFF